MNAIKGCYDLFDGIDKFYSKISLRGNRLYQGVHEYVIDGYIFLQQTVYQFIGKVRRYYVGTTDEYV